MFCTKTTNGFIKELLVTTVEGLPEVTCTNIEVEGKVNVSIGVGGLITPVPHNSVTVE